MANSILRSARERRKRKNAAFAAGASSPLGVLPSALVLVCCVADYLRSFLRRALRSLKKNAAPATLLHRLMENGAVSHDPKAREIRHAMLRVTEETQKKKLSQLSGHLALDWVIFALFP